jgi:hypothetical protein
MKTSYDEFAADVGIFFEHPASSLGLLSLHSNWREAVFTGLELLYHHFRDPGELLNSAPSPIIRPLSVWLAPTKAGGPQLCIFTPCRGMF